MLDPQSTDAQNEILTASKNEVKTLTPEEFQNELTISESSFVPPETREKIKNTNILICGCGSIGNPIAMSAIRSGFQNITVADPDVVSTSNLARQEYTFYQEGKNKAQMTALNMRCINPHASKTIKSIKEGVTIENTHQLISDAGVIVDGVDIRALDIIWEIHKEAAKQKKPVIAGFDLAGTAMLAIYRYDKSDIKPLNGDLSEEKIDEFRKVKMSFETGIISESDFLDYVYDTFTGPINPLDVPTEQFEELINRKDNDTRTYQIGTTSRALSALSIDTIRKILNDEEVKNIIVVDLPSEVRKHNPTIIKKAYLMLRALDSIKKRGERVKKTLIDI